MSRVADQWSERRELATGPGMWEPWVPVKSLSVGP